MSLRLRLIVAFFLFSVVPLVAVTFYSYTSNLRALQVAAQHETEMLTGELTQRMQVVTTQIGDRVGHLMDMPVPATTAVTGTTGRIRSANTSRSTRTVVARATPLPQGSGGQAAPNAPPAPASPAKVAGAAVAAAIDPNTMERQVAGALGDVAMLLNNVEVRGLGRGGGRGPFPASGTPPPGAIPPGGGPFDGGPRAGTLPSRPVLQDGSLASRGRGRGRGGNGRGGFRPDGQQLPGQREGIPTAPVPPLPGTPPQAIVAPQPGAAPQSPAPPSPDADPTHMKLDLTPIRRELFREMTQNGTLETMTPEERQRVGAEVNQRLLGIVQGIQLSAAEVQKKAEAAKQQAATERASSAAAVERGSTAAPVRPAPAVPPPAAAANASAAPPAAPPPPAKPMTRKTALTGNHLDVRVERNGEVVQQVNAEINLPNLLATVFANTRRDSGEIPFAVGKDGHLYAPNDADRARLATLDVGGVSDMPGTKRVGDWIVVTMPDRSGAGLRFGIARPVGNLLSDLRRTTARNAGFGLLFIAIALAGMVPLSGRLTRNLSDLTGGVDRIAQGDYSARVPVRTGDEIGRLAAAFNRMAADVEQHQRSAVEQERIRRELELGRRIQEDMQPREPLHFGLTEVKGVSVPAREVGGDFFNYFQLDSGLVALLVGDVSGKGVGAALLMANIQASLRTRFALGQGLSAIAEAIDRDIEANSPGPVYATLFIAIFDPATRQMRYVNAGHNPQFVLRADGRLEKMTSTGLPVGMLAGHGYREREVQLAAGDLLFFYTDGCVEMENESGDMFGSDRLESLVTAAARGSAAEVLATVEGAIAEFRGGRDLFDDATMMAVTVG
jgi:serine phosphatase RsbU (regulator of sigma subunit)